MKSINVLDYARQLVAAHGPAAEAEAAHKAADLEKAGKQEEAKQWRRVRSAIADLKPAHFS